MQFAHTLYYVVLCTSKHRMRLSSVSAAYEQSGCDMSCQCVCVLCNELTVVVTQCQF